MADVFDTTLNSSNCSFTATAAPILYTTELPNESPAILPPLMGKLVVPKPAHGGEYWAKVTKGLNFSQADRVDPVLYNRILWRGIKGTLPATPAWQKPVSATKKLSDKGAVPSPLRTNSR
jgi:hypothetical protein